MPASSRAHFHVLEVGRAVVDVASHGVIELRAGDLILIPRGDDHRMSSSRAARCTPLARVLELASARGWSLQLGEPPLARMLCGYVDVGAGPMHPLIRALPAVMHVRAPLDDACTHDDAPGMSTNVMHIELGVAGGYVWYPFERSGLFLQAWGNVGHYVWNSTTPTVDSHTYQQAWLIPYVTVHIGFEI